MSSTTHIVLACASDEAYAPYATTTLLSAILWTPHARFTVYYLHPPDFSVECQARIRRGLLRHARRVNLKFLAVPDDRVAGLPLFKTMPPKTIRPVMWYRVFLPELVPEESRVLYLDSDTLVLDSLEPLWNTSLNGQALAATANPFWDIDEDRDWVQTCGLNHGRDYFNSGIMVMDLDYWRRHQVTHRVVAHGLANADWTRFGDQDSLVLVLGQNWKPLAPRWNFLKAMYFPQRNTSGQLFCAEDLHEAARNPAIVHFAGGKKPWLDPRAHPYGRVYQRYLRQLPWPVPHASWGLDDVDNLLTRRRWLRLRNQFRRLRKLF